MVFDSEAFYYSIWVHPAHWRGMFKQQLDERSQHVYATYNIAGSTIWEAFKNVTFLRKHGVQTFKAQGAQSVSVIASVGR